MKAKSLSTTQQRALLDAACGNPFGGRSRYFKRLREKTLNVLKRKGLLGDQWEPTQAGEAYIQDRQKL